MKPSDKEDSFGFLYSRESNEIGKGLPESRCILFLIPTLKFSILQANLGHI